MISVNYDKLHGAEPFMIS